MWVKAEGTLALPAARVVVVLLLSRAVIAAKKGRLEETGTETETETETETGASKKSRAEPSKKIIVLSHKEVCGKEFIG